MHRNSTLNFSFKYTFCKLYRFTLLLILLLVFHLPLFAQESQQQIIEQNFDSEGNSKPDTNSIEENQADFDKEQSFEEEENKIETSPEDVEEENEPEINIYNDAGEEESVNDNEEERTYINKGKFETQNPTILKGHISKVPVGTKLKIILETPIDEVTSMVDDEIIARASENIEIDGMVVIPAGSTVIGKISEINSAKRLHKAGSVRIEFKSLNMPDGREVPILASVLTHSGLIKGKYTKKAALISGATILGPAAAGFGAGLAAEGSLVGAGIGATVGTLAGLGLFAFQKGNMIDLKSGDELNIELTEDALVPSSEIEKSNEDFCELEK